MLPEFKLYLQGKHVGYKKHAIYKSHIHTWHKGITENSEWWVIYVEDKRDGNFIEHDEERQWTTRLDKNGKKIYEGDRVRVNKCDWPYEDEGIIEIINGCFTIEGKYFEFTINNFKDSEMEVADG